MDLLILLDPLILAFLCPSGAPGGRRKMLLQHPPSRGKVGMGCMKDVGLVLPPDQEKVIETKCESPAMSDNEFGSSPRGIYTFLK